MWLGKPDKEGNNMKWLAMIFMAVYSLFTPEPMSTIWLVGAFIIMFMPDRK